jgi:hypothetical protein
MVTSRERRRRDLLEVPAYRLDVRGRVDLRRPGDVVGRCRALGRRPRASPRPGNRGPVAPVGGGIFALGIVFGFITAISGDLDLTQTWLIIGYVLAAFILVNAFVYHAPQARKLEAAAKASPDDQPSAELRALIDAPSATWVNVLDGAVWLALIYVMVAKPFS